MPTSTPTVLGVADGSSVHDAPSQRSAQAPLVDEEMLYVPTAVQLPSDVQETSSSPASAVPWGAGETCSRQRVPSQMVVTGRSAEALCP